MGEIFIECYECLKEADVECDECGVYLCNKHRAVIDTDIEEALKETGTDFCRICYESIILDLRDVGAIK